MSQVPVIPPGAIEVIRIRPGGHPNADIDDLMEHDQWWDRRWNDATDLKLNIGLTAENELRKFSQHIWIAARRTLRAKE